MPGLKRSRATSTPTTEGNVKSKKSGSNVISLAGQSLVTVCLDSGEEYPIHAGTLRSVSSLFGEKLDFLEQADPDGELKLLLVPDVSAETFDTFTHWIYAKSKDGDDVVVVNELNDEDSDDAESTRESEDEVDDGADGQVANDAEVLVERTVKRAATTTAIANGSNGSAKAANTSDDEETPSRSETTSGVLPWYSTLNRKGRVFGRLVDCYIFALRYETVDLRRDVILKLQRCITSWQTLPCPTVIKQALDNLTMRVPLCLYFISCYGYYADYKKVSRRRFATLAPDFLVEVLAITFDRLDDEKDRVTNGKDEDWCDFHEHANDEERKKCEGMREDDPDVEAKRAEAERANAVYRPRRWGGCC